jgi:hypothetical protein
MRKQTADSPADVEAPGIWVARLSGTTTGCRVYVSRNRARNWVEKTLSDADGEWETSPWHGRYECEGSPDSGIVTWYEIRDCEGLVWVDPDI